MITPTTTELLDVPTKPATTELHSGYELSSSALLPGQFVTIKNGDCRTVLKELASESIQCVVTSPPYWGLRDYGHADQIGQEETPDAYVQTMRQVFAEIWRVLKNDGTLWLNLGSSYFGSGQGGNPVDSHHQKQRSNRGSFSYDKRPIRSHSDVPACGSDGKAPRCSTETDFAYSDLCDECRAALSKDNDCTSRPPGQLPPPRETKDRGSEQSDCEKATAAASLLSAQASTIPESSSQHPEGCHHCANCGACLSVLRSSTRDARLCAHRVLCRNGTGWHASASYNSDKDVLDLAYPNLSTPSLNFKPKDLVNIPAMVAEALRADGWYLRSDIIWAKPNTMPESVTDRPTRSHEYIFLLTKRDRYYYDHEAIKEPPSSDLLKQIAEGYNGTATKDFAAVLAQDASATKTRIINGYRNRVKKQRGHSRRHDGFNDHWDNLTKEEQMACGSNKRDVWNVAPANYPEAHFATFPPDLIKPCILAGTKPGDVVLDPFGGSGTTGMVALELGRRAVLVELNESYAQLCRERCNITPGLQL